MYSATGMAAALTVGCVVAIAASIAGDTSQDLKTGYLLGATPWRQQVGELLGVLTSATFVCMTLLLLHRAYGFGSAELPAPQATLMKLVIEGVLQAKLPWVLVGIGGGIALLAEIAGIPSLPFAVGVYLPVTTMTPVFLGGVLRWAVQRRARTAEEKESRAENGVLFGSGLVGGEGLFGVMIAAVVFYQSYTASGSDRPGLPGEIGTTWASKLATAAGVGSDAAAAIALQILASLIFASLAYVFMRRSRTTIGE